MTAPADNTPNGVIADAYQDAGLIQDGDQPGGEQLAKGMRRLRDLINTWQTTGLKLWVNVDTEVPLVALQATYTFKPSGDVNMTKPLRVLEGYYLYATTNIRRPLLPLSWEEWLKLGQVGTANAGSITQYFVNKKQTQLDVTFWPAPDANDAANGAGHVLLQVQITNPETLTETMNFPIEWRMALRWGLADDLCTGQPETIMQRCAQKALMYKEILEAWDVEDAPTRFQPDSRMNMYNSGNFR